MTIKWHKTAFKIALNPHAIQQTGDDGTRLGLSDGLFTIHKANRVCWILSHLASGRKIGDYGTLAHCKIVARQLRESELGIDWASCDAFKNAPSAVRKQFTELVNARR